MKARDVMRVLNICRKTLYLYTKAGKIKVDAKINGQYRYNAESVYRLINMPVPDRYKI